MRNENSLFKLVSALCVVFLFLFTLSACSQKVEDGYYKAVRIHRIDKGAFWGMTGGYMDFLLETMPFIQIKNGDVITTIPFESKEALVDFKSLTGATYNEGRSLLDSIYSIDFKKDTLTFSFYYAGTAQDEKRFLLKYVPISKEKYDEGINKIITKKEAIRKSFTTMDLSTLNYKEQRPVYLENYDSMEAMNEVLNTRKNEDGTRYMSTDYKTVRLRIYPDITYIYHLFEVKGSNLIGKTVANIDEFKFNDFEVYANDLYTQGIVLEKEKMKEEEIVALFNNLNKKNVNMELTTFGLPAKESDGELVGIRNTIAVKWYSDDKVITMTMGPISEKVSKKRVDKKVYITDKASDKQLIESLLYCIKFIGDADVKVYIMGPGFDAVIKENDLHGRQQEFRDSNTLKEYEYVWRGYYER